MVRRHMPDAIVPPRLSRKGRGAARRRGAPGAAGGERTEAVGIAQVAREAGVSTATVSRALSRPDEVREATRERVLAVVRRLGYTPNLAGRSLRAARSRMVLVIIPFTVTPFFTALLLGVERELAAHGYGLLFGSRKADESREAQLFRLAASGAADGILLLDGNTLRAGARRVEQLGFPVVAVGIPSPNRSLPAVLVRDRAAGLTVAEHLLGLGHRRFAYVGGRPGSHPDTERWAGFRAGLEAAGIDADDVLRFEGDFAAPSGIAAAEQLLALPKARVPTAVFAASDMMAIGLMRRLRQGGLHVPQDMSVVGFDGIEFAELYEPPLTTMRQPREAMGRAAAALLCRALAGESIGREDREQVFDATLQLGGSTARAPSRRGRRD